MKHDGFMYAMERFVSSSYALLLEAEKGHEDSMAVGFPQYLPSFDEFVNDLLTWRDKQRALYSRKAM